MTTTGKILVVLNMFMGIFFMGFAMIVYTTRVDLRKELGNRDSTIAKTAADLQSTRTEMEALAQDKAKLEQENEQSTKQYEQEIANLKGTTESLQKDLADFRSRTARDEVNANKAADNQGIRNEEVEQLRKFREELVGQKSQLLKEKSELQDKLQQTSNDLTLTLARNEEMVTQIGELERYITAVRQSYKIPGPEDVLGAVTGQPAPPPPPGVEGVVTRVDREGKFYQISLGEDNGIKPGQQLEVWRQGKDPRYLGKVRVDTSEANTAVVKPVSLNGLIQENDRVGPEIMPHRGKAN